MVNRSRPTGSARVYFIAALVLSAFLVAFASAAALNLHFSDFAPTKSSTMTCGPRTASPKASRTTAPKVTPTCASPAQSSTTKSTRKP
jgi:hypothetical protein